MRADPKLAKAYRERAKSLRAIAEGTAEKMREALIMVAEDCEHLAATIDKLRSNGPH
jgi:hypothetical protein